MSTQIFKDKIMHYVFSTYHKEVNTYIDLIIENETSSAKYIGNCEVYETLGLSVQDVRNIREGKVKIKLIKNNENKR